MTNESLERERWNAELSLRETELKLRMDAARLEENKFEYEKQYRQQELELREKDYLLRSSELQSKEDEVRRQHWFSPLFLAILAAAIAASGNAIVSYLNNSSANKLETLKTESTFRLEESKAEAARILEGIKTGNTEKAAENLEFLVQANLISEHKRAAIMVYLLARKRGQPTFKGSECPCRFFALRALHTTRSRGPARHRPAGDGVGHQRAARPLAHRSIIGPALLV